MAKKTLITAIAAVLSMLCGLCGCKKEPKPAQHTLSDITSVSIFSGNMDRRYSYFFRIHKEEDKWLFDTECFTHDREEETAFENREIGSEYVDELLDILEKNDSIAYAENYKAPKSFPVFEAADESSCGFSLTFTDGSKYATEDTQSELEEFFYRLAESLDHLSAQHEASDITTVSLFCSHMDFNYCYSFYVYKEDDVWLFDASCFTNSFTDQTEFESRKILDEDVEAMLDIIEQNGMIVYAENYVKPEDSPYMIMDETKYSFGLRFSDGNSYMTSSAQGKLEDLFYSLAEKYSDAE